jgi:hypothetical protein
MRIPRSLVVVVAATAIGAAACGSSKASTATATAPTTQAAPTTTAAPATTTTIDQAAAKTQITANFATFFNGADSNYDGRLAYLQNGTDPILKALFVKLSATKGADLSYVKVTQIDIQATSDCSDNGYTLPCALVHYDLYLKGTATPVLPGEKGYAVLENGVWKVSRTAYCVLSALGGSTCPPG